MMRRPFQKLMEMVAGEMDDTTATLGELAARYGEPVERVMDAIDAVRVCLGEQTYIAPVPMPEEIPVRPCCGRRHWSVVCLDGKVMCCICFDRFDRADLNVLEDGGREDVCKQCAVDERRARRSVGLEGPQ